MILLLILVSAADQIKSSELHAYAPFSIGAPTLFPHSVQEPS